MSDEVELHEQTRDDYSDALLQNGPARRRRSGSNESVEEPERARQPIVRRRHADESIIRLVWRMGRSVIPSIVLALVGSVLAGEVLAHIRTWDVFEAVPELFILVPILLNLKGNIELNLAARFSTSASIGELDLKSTRQTLVIGNMALLQVQALVASLVAAILSFLLGLTSRGESYFEAILVLCSSMLSASLSTLIVAGCMCSLIIVSRKYGINPDNIATPIASSLGDLITLTVLGIIATAMRGIEFGPVTTLIFVALLAAIVIAVFFTLRNAYVQELLLKGWLVLFIALAISSATGLVLDRFINDFRAYGLISSVVTAAAGNVGSIYTSRISTALHSSTTERYVPVAIVLWTLSTPILCTFLAFAWGTGQIDVSLAFGIAFCVLCGLLIAISLGGGAALALFLHRHNRDPDTDALPLLTSGVDVIGQILLAGTYAIAAPRVDRTQPAPTPIVSSVTSALSSVLPSATVN